MISSSQASASAPPVSRERAIRAGFGVLAAISFVTGAFMVIDPNAFFEQVGPFGAFNDHYVRDVASWTLAFALVLAIAAGNPAWRVPVLGFGIAQHALHIVNHIVDVGDADPGWVGWFDVISLSALLGVMVWLLSVVRSEAAGPRSAERSRKETAQ